MPHRRADVVATALTVLDTWGLADLTMRRLGAELGVQPSALYHHVANKQTLLAAVADEILVRGPHRSRPDAWDDRVAVICTDLRDAMLAWRDGAEVVATVHAFGLGAGAAYAELLDVLAASAPGAGLDPDLARTSARTLLHYVFGHTQDEQTHLQAGSAGAIPDSGLGPGRDDFAIGLGIVLAGLRQLAFSVG